MTELEQSQQKEIARLREENRLLRQKLDLVIRQLFGKKSTARSRTTRTAAQRPWRRRRQRAGKG